MSIVSDHIGLISPKQFGNTSEGSSQSLDLSDDTFAKILSKQFSVEPSSDSIPLGINIGEFDGVNPIFGTNKTNIEQLNNISSADNTSFPNFNNNDMTTSELLTFYPSIFDTKPDLTSTSSNGLFNFERKVAANSYGKYAKNIVTDLNEFVTDTIKAKS